MIAIALALSTVVLAGLLSMADGALLAVHASPDHAADSLVDRARREREHRTLAMGRVLLYLAAGAAIGVVIDFRAFSIAPRLALQLVVILAIVALTESASRAIGQVHSIAVIRRIRPLTLAITIVLRPAAAFGDRKSTRLNS